MKKILDFLNSRPWLLQFIKFGFVGVSNTLISYVTYTLLVYAGCHYMIASAVGFVVSVLNSYLWNNHFVFKKKEGEVRSAIATLAKTFASYALTGLLLQNILLYIFIDQMGISKYIAPLISLIVTIPLNFIMNKFWSFKTRRAEKKDGRAEESGKAEGAVAESGD